MSIRFAAALVIALFLVSGLVVAQQKQDDDSFRKLVDDIAKTVFFFAWPTDTYDHSEFGDVNLKPGGVDVSFVLYGKSWLEGKLWTEVVVEIRNGSITNVRFGRYSALIPPGTTMQALGTTLDELNKEYKREQAQAPRQLPPPAPYTAPSAAPIAVLCLHNPTPNPIVYSIPSGQAAWQNLAPNQTWMFWHNGPADFTLSFADSLGSTVSKTVHVPGSMQASKPDSCAANMTYDFLLNGQRIGLAPETWIEGTESPFDPTLVRSSTQGNWRCAAGYKWATPDDPKSLLCIANDVGLVGLEMEIENGESYPRVISVRPGSAADRAGIPSGSYLMEVDGQPTKDLSIEEVIGRVRGPVNTYVRVSLSIPGRDRMVILDLKRE